MNNKAPVSLSLSEKAVEFLSTQSNKSQAPNKILEALLENRSSIKFIELNLGFVNYEKLVEYGLEQLMTEAHRFRNLRIHSDEMRATKENKPRPLRFILNDALDSGINNWKDLIKYCEENGRIIDAKSPNDLPMATPYHYENKWLLSQTEGKFIVKSNGEIIKY